LHDRESREKLTGNALENRHPIVMPSLRLDKLLWFLRLTKSRSLAQSIIVTGAVRIDGERQTCPHKPVSVGQTITLVVNNHVRVIRITAIPTRRGPASEAQSCYCDLTSPEMIDASPE
jgi:ribosome-associated heat shock protein Hsp15